MTKRMTIWATMLGILLIVSACGNSAEEELFEHIEEAIALESEFEQQQEPLVEAEEREYELFEEMVQLGLGEMDEIEEKVNEALELASERNERMNAERESIESAYAQLMEGEEMIEDVEDAHQDEVQAVFEAMQSRYEIHKELYDNYLQAIALDEALYNMFLNEELSFEELEDQINEVNELYRTINENKEAFNDKTDTFNEAKEQFYESAGLLEA
ncbi:hypothetical protein DH09_03950 [Bacillaceae bacterium JMAK1]|nr:hypothetical protein DH09_03950 [Bacillaceae bacterium JMAK1]